MRVITSVKAGLANALAYFWPRGDWWFVRQKCLSLRDGFLKRLYVRRYAMIMHQHCASIPLEAEIPFRPCLPHGLYGIFISRRAKLGKDVVIFQHVTIGSNTLRDHGGGSAKGPSVGDFVYVGAGAKIIGEVTVGASCRIGANCCVYKDLPPNAVAVNAPMRVIQKSSLDNRFYSSEDDKILYWRDGGWKTQSL